MDWRVHGLGKVEGGGGVSRWRVEGPGLVEEAGSAIGGGGNGTLSAFAALGTGRLPWLEPWLLQQASAISAQLGIQ